MILKQSYKEKGFLEKAIHQKLKGRQVEQGSGVEWFRISAEQADVLIKATILEDDLAKEAKIPTEEEIALKKAADEAYFAQLLENERIWRIENNQPLPAYYRLS